MDIEKRKELMNWIEAQWVKRAGTMGYERGSDEYREAQLEYFVGAMAAMEGMGLGIPPYWCIALMTGRDIVAEAA